MLTSFNPQEVTDALTKLQAVNPTLLSGITARTSASCRVLAACVGAMGQGSNNEFERVAAAALVCLADCMDLEQQYNSIGILPSSWSEFILWRSLRGQIASQNKRIDNYVKILKKIP